MAKGKVSETVGHTVGRTVGSIGDYLKEQRVAAQLSLRQLAEQAGVSNPYLSQIERGLRRPSAEVLGQLAKALRISAEQLYVRAGILDPDERGATDVELAVLADPGLTERQKQSLLDVYSSFVALNPLPETGADTATEGIPADEAGLASDGVGEPGEPADHHPDRSTDQPA